MNRKQLIDAVAELMTEHGAYGLLSAMAGALDKLAIRDNGVPTYADDDARIAEADEWLTREAAEGLASSLRSRFE